MDAYSDVPKKKNSWFVIFKPGTVAYHLLLGEIINVSECNAQSPFSALSN